MPGGDGTGPIGMETMTGRAAGYCLGYQIPGYMNTTPGKRAKLSFGSNVAQRGIDEINFDSKFIVLVHKAMYRLHPYMSR